jgi:hypothetical protein
MNRARRLPAKAEDTLSAGSFCRRHRHRKISWRALPVVLGAYVFVSLERINFGDAQAQMREDLAVSNAICEFGGSILFSICFPFRQTSKPLPGEAAPQVGDLAWTVRTIGGMQMLLARSKGVVWFAHERGLPHTSRNTVADCPT